MRKSGNARTCAAAAVTAVGTTAVLLTAGASAPAALADPSSPVEVTVARDKKELREGGTAEYTVTLRNRTGHDYRGLTVAQMLPASFHPSKTEPTAAVTPSEASWKTDLPAKSSLKFTLKGDLGTIAEQEAGHVPGGGKATDGKPRQGRSDGSGNGEDSGDSTGKATARLSTSVCVQEAVTVRDGKVTRDKTDKRPDDGAGTATGGTTSGGTGEAGKGVDGTGRGGPGVDSTVGRILTCDSEAAVLRASNSQDGAGSSWMFGSIGTALVLAGGAGFAVHRHRTRSMRRSRP